MTKSGSKEGLTLKSVHDSGHIDFLEASGGLLVFKAKLPTCTTNGILISLMTNFDNLGRERTPQADWKEGRDEGSRGEEAESCAVLMVVGPLTS